jgi:CRISPR-associated protein Csb2
MTVHFALTVHLLDRRYHGTPEWPPAPARVFQALVAGAAQGRHVPDSAARALKLLEGVSPVIAAPTVRRGQRVSMFVPNNDLDSVDGDPGRIGEIRAKKAIQPYLIEGEPSFLYAWPLSDRAMIDLPALAEGLYQFGRGIDPAWAVGELIEAEQLEARLRSHRGTVHRPVVAEGSNELAVPTRNSFESLVERFEAALNRLRADASGRTRFVQQPKAHFAMVGYDGSSRYHLLELRKESEPAKSAPWPVSQCASLIRQARDTAVEALSAALPDRKGDIERVLVGRKSDGTNAGPMAERVRLVPLPSIGHEHADYSLRRILVQVPAGPLMEADVLWAFGGRRLFDAQTGEIHGTTLALAPADDMVRRYTTDARTWRSVTPVALSAALRRRIEPKRQQGEAKSAAERKAEESAARHAIAQALRQAGVAAQLVQVHVQREPFAARGVRAERFASGSRFPKEALWHVEVELDRLVGGPLVLGDGRFLGLGVMEPIRELGAYECRVEGGLPSGVDTNRLARALRRAVMARVQASLGVRDEQALPSYFHGHASDGEPLRSEHSNHLAFAVDLRRSRLLIVPPHLLDGWDRPFKEQVLDLATLDRALIGFKELRVGAAGVLSIGLSKLTPDDRLVRRSRVFRSVSDYVVSRHAKRVSGEEAVILDVQRECQRRRLPNPESVRVHAMRGVPGVGVMAHVELSFHVAVNGPLLLGRTRYLGGGLFEPVEGTANGNTLAVADSSHAHA